MANQPPQIKITKWLIGDDPEIPIWHVVMISDDKGVWTEMFGGEELLRAFLRGVKAGYGMQNIHLPEPEIPTNAKPWPGRLHSTRTRRTSV